MSFNRISAILLIFIFLVLSLNFVSASDNSTGVSLEETEGHPIENIEIDSETPEDVISDESIVSNEKTGTNIEVNGMESYYTEKADFSGYVRDANGTPVANKKVTINIVGKDYIVFSDDKGMFKLPINLKPNTYDVLVKFGGDGVYESSNASTFVKVTKLPLIIKTKDFSTYVGSDIFFTANVYNKITNSPVKGIKVLFKVYSPKTKKYYDFYAVTNEKGVATLDKNFVVGDYAVYTSAVNKNAYSYENSQKKSSVKIKPTAEFGCCSFFIQVSSSEAVAGFRRDSTYAAEILIISQSWWGKPAVKQYKTVNSYSFHLIITGDGWMVGTGGADNPTINRNIEKLAAKMATDGYLQRPALSKIQNYIRSLGIGHFSIKTPNGRYAAVWKDGMYLGVLKPGEFISVPNYKSCYRHGTFSKYGAHPASAGIKIGATDSYGVNKRDIIVYHWRATTKDYKTTSLVKVYGSNDDGKYSGRSTAYLKDNIRFKNVFHSKNSLPYPIRGKVLGIHNYGNIDKFIKTPTVVSAPKVTYKVGTSGLFKVTLKNNAKKPVANAYIYVKVYSSKFSKLFHLKTDAMGMVKINTQTLNLGKYNVLISQANNRYWTSGTSEISIVK